MITVVLVIHLMIATALVAVILLQRSEGGALGIGGGGGAGGGFMTGRGAANVLTRATAFLAGLFFLTSITLTLLARQDATPTSIFPGQTQGDGLLPGLAPLQPAAPQQNAPDSGAAPQPQSQTEQAPATPAPAQPQPPQSE